MDSNEKMFYQHIAKMEEYKITEKGTKITVHPKIIFEIAENNIPFTNGIIAYFPSFVYSF